MKLWKKLTAAVLLTAACCTVMSLQGMSAAAFTEPETKMPDSVLSAVSADNVKSESIVSGGASANAAAGSITLSDDGVLTLHGELTKEQIWAYRENESVTSVVAAQGTVLPADCSSLFRNGFQEELYDERGREYYQTQYYWKNVTSVDLSHADKSKITKANGMFCALTCYLDDADIIHSSYRSINLGGIDFSSVPAVATYNIFHGCNQLTSLILPDGMTEIYHWTFSCCSSLTSITIPDGVKTIEGSAFCGCSGLTSITIPDGVKTIGGNAFYGCSGLTSITIPDSVTSIGYNAFEECENLAIYGTVGSFAEQYALRNDIPFIELGKNPIQTAAEVTLSRTSFPYTGRPIKVGSYLTVTAGGQKLKYGTDFTLEYKNNLNAGTASVIIKGMGEYDGKMTKTYQITTVEIDSVTLPQNEFYYSGGEVRVGMFIRVRAGNAKPKYPNDFYLVYNNNVECGTNTASVTVIGRGNCTGSVTVYYSIVPFPEEQETLLLTSCKRHIRANWAPVTGYGFQVQYVKGTADTQPDWNKSSYFRAYKSSFTLNPAWHDFKKGEVWYVRVRSYYYESGREIYGEWSEASSVIIE